MRRSARLIAFVVVFGCAVLCTRGWLDRVPLRIDMAASIRYEVHTLVRVHQLCRFSHTYFQLLLVLRVSPALVVQHHAHGNDHAHRGDSSQYTLVHFVQIMILDLQKNLEKNNTSGDFFSRSPKN